MTFKLRPYQEEARNAVLRDWSEGFTDVLGTAATGLGKTAIFLALLDQVLEDGKRGLVLAHRKELIEQPVARLYQYFPEWMGRAGIVMADQNEAWAQLVVATVQTLNAPSRAPGNGHDSTRLDGILQHGHIDFLITDEAHHSPSKTYMSVYERLREANSDLRHLGVTATPIRADGDGLAKIYQKESFHYGIIEGIRKGFLAPVRWLAIQTAVSVAGVATRHGDFVAKQLQNVFETDNCYELVAASHQKYAGGRQAVAFTVTVDGAYRLAEKFREAGISAEAADGTTNKKERSRILNSFASGKIDVLCNVGLYTEGLDVPQASCIHQVRPTKSDGLYIQMVGRALRIFPGKEDALVLDYAPLEVRNIAMMGDVLGVPLRKESYIEEKDELGEVVGGFTFDGKFSYIEGNPAEIISRQLDYLEISPWSWYRKDGWLTLGLGKASDEIERTLVISPPEDGVLHLYGVARRNGGGWQVYDLSSGAFEDISNQAEDVISRYGNPIIAARSRSWRSQSPTDRQISFARRIRGAFQPGLSKGELAQSITHHLAVSEVQKII
jgi:superfamily II DNA or RNA helicase